MYTRTREYIKSNSVSNDLFIEGYDHSNSELLYKLDQYTERKKYTITKYDKRIDLISIDIYGSDNYSWILLYINKVSVNDLLRGRELEYITKDEIHDIISSLDGRY